MKLFPDRIIRWLAVVGHTIGIYGAWSRLWRWGERKWGHYPPLKAPASVMQLVNQAKAAANLWLADEWFRLWDATSLPGRLQARIENREGIGGSCDCDEFAVWCAERLRLLDLVYGSKAPEAVGERRMLQVVWRSPAGKLVAHHVCAFQWLPPLEERERRGILGMRWWHVGNWGLFGPFEDMAGAVEDIARTRLGGTVISAWHCDPDTLKDWRRV